MQQLKFNERESIINGRKLIEPKMQGNSKIKENQSKIKGTKRKRKLLIESKFKQINRKYKEPLLKLNRKCKEFIGKSKETNRKRKEPTRNTRKSSQHKKKY